MATGTVTEPAEPPAAEPPVVAARQAELNSELLECARYGEEEELAEMLALGAVVNHADTGGNTALHKAAANGHVECVRRLVAAGARFSLNASGNSPLHWAAQNGRLEVARLLLGSFPDLDVLARNSFGQGSLSDAFRSGNTDLVAMLLEHDSCTEEKLLAVEPALRKHAAKVKKTNAKRHAAAAKDAATAAATTTTSGAAAASEAAGEGGEDGNAEEPPTPPPAPDHNEEELPTPPPPPDQQTDDAAMHEFSFCLGLEDQLGERFAELASRPPIRIRELPILHADDPFGSESAEDTTGNCIWVASLIMARWVAEMAPTLEGKVVCELGAGCGVPSISALVLGRPARAYLSDLNDVTLDNLRHNLTLNEAQFNPASAEVVRVDWDREDTWPGEPVDVVLGSDLVYSASIVPLLTKVLNGILKPGGLFMYVAPETGRAGLPEMLSGLENDFAHVDRPVPQPYYNNPLTSQDENECMLHFHNLYITPHRLHSFRRRGHLATA